MTAQQFLEQDGMKPSSFDNQMRNWSYTEYQLLAFAERYYQARVEGQSKKTCDSLHSTDWNGKCFKCGEQENLSANNKI